MHKKRNLPGFTQAPASPRNKCAENETKKQEKKRRARKNVIDGGEHFIGCLRKTGGND